MREETFATLVGDSGGPPGEGWALVLSVAEALQAGGALEGRLSEICALVARSLAIDAAAILLVDPDANRLVVKGQSGLDDDYVRLLNAERTIGLGGAPEGWAPTTRAFKLGRIVVVHDIGADDTFLPWREAALRQGFASFLAVPLVVRDRVLGCLNGYSRTPGRFAESEVGLLAVLAQFLAVTTELAELYEALRMQLDLLDRSERIHEALTSAVFQEDSLTALAATLGHLLDAEVLIVDRHGTPAARSFGVPESVVEAVAQEVRRREALHRQSREPFPIPRPAGAERAPFLLARAAQSGERLYGYVVLAKAEAAVDALDLRSLEQAATVAALAFSRHLAQLEALSRQKAELLFQLLAEGAPLSPGLRRRAEALGLPASARYRVLLLELPTGEAPHAGDLERAEAVLARRRLPALAGLQEGRLVLVAGECAVEAALRQELLRALRLEGRRLRLVASSPAADLGGVASAFREAEAILTAAARLGSRQELLRAEDLGIVRLLLDARNTDELRRFAEEVLGPLLRDEGVRPLLETLAAFLECDGDVARTAARLHVHPNTVRYRLGRLDPLVGRRLRSLSGLLELRLALTLAELAGSGEGTGR